MFFDATADCSPTLEKLDCAVFIAVESDIGST